MNIVAAKDLPNNCHSVIIYLDAFVWLVDLDNSWNYIQSIPVQLQSRWIGLIVMPILGASWKLKQEASLDGSWTLIHSFFYPAGDIVNECYPFGWHSILVMTGYNRFRSNSNRLLSDVIEWCGSYVKQVDLRCIYPLSCFCCAIIFTSCVVMVVQMIFVLNPSCCNNLT